jgi:hypothetical protein
MTGSEDQDFEPPETLDQFNHSPSQIENPVTGRLRMLIFFFGFSCSKEKAGYFSDPA